ncbi:hypothetical protein BHE74_00006942 [Ensete ventricosum]|nr:hypothetical protein BHE74_00006942 [Ensete ventricosum]
MFLLPVFSGNVNDSSDLCVIWCSFVWFDLDILPKGRQPEGYDGRCYYVLNERVAL